MIFIVCINIGPFYSILNLITRSSLQLIVILQFVLSEFDVSCIF